MLGKYQAIGLVLFYSQVTGPGIPESGQTIPGSRDMVGVRPVGNNIDKYSILLQLLSHLEGDALNVALLVPEARRATQTGLVGALTEHYGSPGQLADYRHQFEKAAQKEGEDPSIFAIALETLAVKAFGDMGHTARLRLICDRFIASHDSCALRRHLNSVSPETPIRHIVDRCRVWESHAETEARRFSKPGPERALPIYTVDEPGRGVDDRMVVAVTIPPAAPDPLES